MGNEAMFERLRETFYFFRSNLSAISVVVLTINAPLVLLQLVLEQASSAEGTPAWQEYLPYVVSFLVGPLSSAALIYLIARLVEGREWTLAGIIGDAARIWPQLLLATAIAGGMVVMGMFALILPGIYLFLRLVFVEFVVVLEGRMPTAAIERGFQLTRDRVLELMQPLALLFAGYITLHWLVGRLLLAAGADHSLIMAFFTLVFSVLSSLFTVLLFRLYQVATSATEPTGKSRSQ